METHALIRLTPLQKLIKLSKLTLQSKKKESCYKSQGSFGKDLLFAGGHKQGDPLVSALQCWLFWEAN